MMEFKDLDERTRLLMLEELGKEVGDPRPESERLIGKSIGARALLDDLRTNIGVDTTLGLPAGPNSGLSAMILEISRENKQC